MIETVRNGHLQATDTEKIPEVPFGTSDRCDLGLRVPSRGELEFSVPGSKVTIVTGPMRPGDITFVG